MAYTIDDIDRIADFKTWSNRQKTDELLRIDAALYCNLGTDSTKKDREEVRRQSRKIYQAIKKVDPPLGERFLQNFDKV